MKDGMNSALPVGEKFAIMMSGLTGTKERALAAAERPAVTVSDILSPSVIDASGLVGAAGMLGAMGIGGAFSHQGRPYPWPL
jgi:hypothetical protein